jgi:hypothetical protein
MVALVMRRRSTALLVVAVAPLVWMLHLTLSYWLVPAACDAGSNAAINVVTALGLAATSAVAWFGWRSDPERRRRRGSVLTDTELDHRTAAGIARLAFVLGAYFTLVVAVTGLVPIVLRPCA